MGARAIGTNHKEDEMDEQKRPGDLANGPTADAEPNRPIGAIEDLKPRQDESDAVKGGAVDSYMYFGTYHPTDHTD
jgi:hypothetical protein